MSNNELIYYYTNDENMKEKFRPVMLPGDASLDSGEDKDSGAGMFVKK